MTPELAATLVKLRTSEQALKDSTVKIARLQEEAVRAARMKDDFLASVSHELRTPLHAILGWVSVLRKAQRSPDMLDKGLEVIERNARAQKRIVEELLDEASIVSGSLCLSMEPVDLEPVVASAVDSLQLAAFARGVTVEVRVTGDARVHGDRVRLRQVVSNLVGNAIKFTPEGGVVAVEMRRRGGSVVLEVRDTGEGMPASFIPHAFDTFRQRHVAQSDRRGGVGLGLTLVKQLVELHGGSVVAASGGEGVGSSFSVTLPAARDGWVRPTPVPTSPHSSGTFQRQLAGLDILVVEDEPDARELLQITLEARGAVVVSVSSAREALEALEAGPFHLLVSDIAMAELDGLELIQRVRRLPPPACDIPAVALSAHTLPQDAQRSWTSGFDLHIAKPADLSVLVEALVQLVRDGRPSAGEPVCAAS